MTSAAVSFSHSPPSAPLGSNIEASTNTTVLKVGSFPPGCENFHGDTCFYEQGERTYDECADVCRASRGAMVCPTSQLALEHIVLRHRDASFTSASVGEPLQQLWARNKCPASSALGGRRWRAADYERVSRSAWNASPSLLCSVLLTGPTHLFRWLFCMADPAAAARPLGGAQRLLCCACPVPVRVPCDPVQLEEQPDCKPLPARAWHRAGGGFHQELDRGGAPLRLQHAPRVARRGHWPQ